MLGVEPGCAWDLEPCLRKGTQPSGYEQPGESPGSGQKFKALVPGELPSPYNSPGPGYKRISEQKEKRAGRLFGRLPSLSRLAYNEQSIGSESATAWLRNCRNST